MSTLDLWLVEHRLLPGCSAGLAEKTALVELGCNGAESFDGAAEARVRQGVLRLCPEQPLPGVSPDDWPGAFLVGDASQHACAEFRLAEWVVAVSIAVQRWARDPVWRGRVISADADRLRLAIPWSREPLLRSAVPLALRLITFWSRSLPDAAQQEREYHHFRLGLTEAQHGGLPTGSLQFIRAAVDREIPVEVLPGGCLQLGWGAANERLDGAATGRTGLIASSWAQNRDVANQILVAACVPVGEAVGDDHTMLVVREALVAANRGDEDVAAAVHPDNRALAVRAARLVGLDIVGLDFRCPDITRSWRDVGGGVVRVRAQPDLSMYTPATADTSVHGAVIDALFAGSSSRIPTAAITGTNGKSTTASMLHRIWTTAGKLTGLCTTAQLRIGGEVVSSRNLSGFPGARIILNDPGVQAAVFEMPRKGLIVFGHPCDRYDVAAILNVGDDHIGVDGIDTIEQMAELKAEVLQRSTNAVVVNADDPLCLRAMAGAGTQRSILVAKAADNPAVIEHRGRGGEAVFLGERDGESWIVLAAGSSETSLMPVHDVPATMNGLLRFNEDNAMFAAAVAWAQGVDLSVIRRGLGTFQNSRQQNPGRYNFFDGLPFQLMLDYGHNPDAVLELCEIVSGLPVVGRRIFCTVSFGNRHGHHFAETAGRLAESFDHFAIGCAESWIRKYRTFGGADPAETALAVKRQALLDNGVDAGRISVGLNQQDVIRAALALAGPGDLLVIQSEPHTALPLIDEFLAAAADGCRSDLD